MLVLLASLARAAAPTVDLAEEADLLFRRGIEAYRKGDVEDALERLLASERLVPNRNVTFNIARCYDTLGAVDQAWRHYAAYAAAEADPVARAEADKALARLDGLVARVAVETEPAGATIYVERRDLGTRGTTPVVLALPPGEHTLLADRDGFTPATHAVKLVRGQLATVELRLDAPGSAPEPAPIAPAAPGARWTGTVVGAGGVAIAAVAPGACALLPGRLEGAGLPLDGPEPLLGAGSALAAVGPPLGLTVDTTIDGHIVRARLSRVDKRTVALSDASALHATLFARCQPTDPDGRLAAAVAGLPAPVRPDAVAVLAEWAAWRGATDVPAAAARCSAGDCASLVEALVR